MSWYLNYHNTWHEGWNRTDQVRYSGLLGLTINVTDLPEFQTELETVH